MAEKDKDVIEKQVKEIRRKLSIAKAELDRIKKNGRITRKGRRNRKDLLKECTVISVEELVNFMEKETSRLRKLKRVYVREKKTEEARKINKAFQQDPRRVYSSLREMVSEQADKERPNTKQGVRPRAMEFLRILNKQQVTGRHCGRARGLGTSRQSGWKRSDRPLQAVYQSRVWGSVT